MSAIRHSKAPGLGGPVDVATVRHALRSSWGKRFTRRQVLRAGGAGAAGATILGSAGCSLGGEAGGDPQAEGERRNVLFILTDSTRTDYIGVYDGNDKARTPNIDALARESLRFTRAVPEAMPTVPVRRAILTGTRSFPFRDWEATDRLPPLPGWSPIPEHKPVFPEHLKRDGVATAYITDNPFLIGPRFEDVRRTLDTSKSVFLQGEYRGFNKPVPRSRWAPPAAVAKYVLPALRGKSAERRLRQEFGLHAKDRKQHDYAAARVIGGGMKLLEELKDKQPFFLGVDAFDPHEAFDPPGAYKRRFGEWHGDVDPLLAFETPYSKVEDVDISDEEIDRMRQLYAAELTFVDAWIGRLLNKLEDLGLAQNTMVVYLSDHGVTLGERGILGKYAPMIHKEIYKVPFIVRHPGGKRAGDTSDYFASTHDVAPTLLSFLGLTVPGRMDGEDLTVMFDGHDPPERPYWTTAYGAIVGAGDERWVMIADNQGKKRRLYDTQADPDEIKDVSGENSEVVDRLWQNLVDEAGGTMPVFGRKGVEGG